MPQRKNYGPIGKTPGQSAMLVPEEGENVVVYGTAFLKKRKSLLPRSVEIRAGVAADQAGWPGAPERSRLVRAFLSVHSTEQEVYGDPDRRRT